jgi:hypothetical protein
VEPAEWKPASVLERDLLNAVQGADTDAYLTAISTAELVVPISPQAARGEEAVTWGTAQVDGRTLLLAFTSPEAMRHATQGEGRWHRPVTFCELAAAWPDPRWGLAVDPLLPVQAFLDAGVVARVAGAAVTATEDGERIALVDGEPPVMQKVLPHHHVPFYLEKGYDWVAGYVHRAADVLHLDTPAKLVHGLGLTYQGSPFSPDDDVVHVLRWPALVPSLYRPAYGGTDTEAMTAMDGWVVEHAPFVGTGFAASTEFVIPEYKLDTMRLPHSAEIHRVSAVGGEAFVAMYDADLRRWLTAIPVEALREAAAEDAVGDAVGDA